MNRYQIAREVLVEWINDDATQQDFDYWIKQKLDQQQAEPVCICCLRVEDGIVTPNPDCPLHGGLHGKNPYKEQQAEEE